MSVVVTAALLPSLHPNLPFRFPPKPRTHTLSISIPRLVTAARRRRRWDQVVAYVDDGDADDGGGPDDYDMDKDEVEELDNRKDFEFEYDTLLSGGLKRVEGMVEGEDIAMVQSKSFVSTQGWDSEMVVDYRISEEDFHKISLTECDFFIMNPP